MATTSPATRRAVPLNAALMLAGLALVWGGGWPVMKHVLGEMPVFSFRIVTAWGAGLAVLVLSALVGNSVRLPRSEWKMATVCALLNVTGWFYFSALALTMLPAGRTSVLAYTMPLFAFLAGMAIVGERPTASRSVGLACGLGAVALLAGQHLAQFGEAPLGVLTILAGAASWGVGTVLQKQVQWRTSVLTLTGWQLIIGGTPMGVLALLYDSAPFVSLTASGIAGLVYVVFAANLFGYWAWFSIVRLVPTAMASLGVLLVPLCGVASSNLLLEEPVGWPELGALALVMAALATVLPLPGLPRRR